MGGKTLTRADLAEAVVQKVGLPRNESQDLVEIIGLEARAVQGAAAALDRLVEMVLDQRSVLFARDRFGDRFGTARSPNQQRFAARRKPRIAGCDNSSCFIGRCPDRLAQGG